MARSGSFGWWWQIKPGRVGKRDRSRLAAGQHGGQLGGCYLAAATEAALDLALGRTDSAVPGARAQRGPLRGA